MPAGFKSEWWPGSNRNGGRLHVGMPGRNESESAFRRNHRYGTIVCDLERREVVALLPDREIPTVEAWLAAHPGIEILSRDRGGGYGEAATKALPKAVQVADRWHLMENASAAFLDAVRKTMRTIRSVIGATVVDPELLTCAEQLQYQGYLRREETNAAILALSKRACRSSGTRVRPGIAESWSAGCCGASAPTCSGFAKARLRPIFPFLRRNGQPAVTTARSCGAAPRRKVFGAPHEWLENGRRVGAGRRRPAARVYKRRPRPEQSPA